MAASPTENSLKRLRKDGYQAAVVEKWNPHMKIRQDLFGFIDVVGVNPESTGVLAVQTTTKHNMGSRVKKIMDECGDKAVAWLKAQNRIEVHGWVKVGHRWHVTIREIFVVQDKLIASEPETE